MEHKCGGKIDFVSITRKDTNVVDVLLICDRCGQTEESTHYLYDDRIGKKALVGDVWYQVMDIRSTDYGIEYKLYSRQEWIESCNIKEFK